MKLDFSDDFLMPKHPLARLALTTEGSGVSGGVTGAPPAATEPPAPPAPPAPAPAAATGDPDVLAAERRAREEESRRRQAAEEKYEKLRKEQEERESKELEEEGKWRELAERNNQKAAEERRQAEERVKQMADRVITAELRARLSVEGVTDSDFHILADRSKLTLNDAGEVVGLDECVTDLRARKPAIFGPPRARSTTTAPPPPPASDVSAGPTAVTADQVREMDRETYAKHKQRTLSDLRRRRA